MELKKQLKQDGIAKGLCSQYQGLIDRSQSIEALVRLFIRGIDFCIKHDYPTLEFMRENFKGKSEPYGGYVDDEITGLRNAPDVVLNGGCKAMLEYDEYSVSRIYIRHSSQAAVNVSDHAIVTIDAFDSSHLVVAVAGSDAQVIVNQYDDAKVECIGSGIKVKNIGKKSALLSPSECEQPLS